MESKDEIAMVVEDDSDSSKDDSDSSEDDSTDQELSPRHHDEHEESERGGFLMPVALGARGDKSKGWMPFWCQKAHKEDGEFKCCVCDHPVSLHTEHFRTRTNGPPVRVRQHFAHLKGSPHAGKHHSDRESKKIMYHKLAMCMLAEEYSRLSFQQACPIQRDDQKKRNNGRRKVCGNPSVYQGARGNRPPIPEFRFGNDQKLQAQKEYIFKTNNQTYQVDVCLLQNGQPYAIFEINNTHASADARQRVLGELVHGRIYEVDAKQVVGAIHNKQYPFKTIYVYQPLADTPFSRNNNNRFVSGACVECLKQYIGNCYECKTWKWTTREHRMCYLGKAFNLDEKQSKKNKPVKWSFWACEDCSIKCPNSNCSELACPRLLKDRGACLKCWDAEFDFCAVCNDVIAHDQLYLDQQDHKRRWLCCRTDKCRPNCPDDAEGFCWRCKWDDVPLNGLYYRHMHGWICYLNCKDYDLEGENGPIEKITCKKCSKVFEIIQPNDSVKTSQLCHRCQWMKWNDEALELAEKRKLSKLQQQQPIPMDTKQDVPVVVMRPKPKEPFQIPPGLGLVPNNQLSPIPIDPPKPKSKSPAKKSKQPIKLSKNQRTLGHFFNSIKKP